MGRKSKKIILLVLLIASCTPINKNYLSDSRDQALYCGKIAAEHNETKILFTPATLPSEWSAQAKTKIKGEWKWLQMKNDGSCYIGYQTQFKLLNEFSVSDFEQFMKLWDNLPPELRLPPSAWMF